MSFWRVSQVFKGATLLKTKKSSVVIRALAGCVFLTFFLVVTLQLSAQDHRETVRRPQGLGPMQPSIKSPAQIAAESRAKAKQAENRLRYGRRKQLIVIDPRFHGFGGFGSIPFGPGVPYFDNRGNNGGPGSAVAPAGSQTVQQNPASQPQGTAQQASKPKPQRIKNPYFQAESKTQTQNANSTEELIPSEINEGEMESLLDESIDE